MSNHEMRDISTFARKPWYELPGALGQTCREGWRWRWEAKAPVEATEGTYIRYGYALTQRGARRKMTHALRRDTYID